MCDCISYNGQKPGQTGTPEVIVDVPEWAGVDRKTICIDSCIAEAVKMLWANRVWTLGSCCGHNSPEKRTVIVDRSDREKAIALLDGFDRTVKVGAWELVWT